MREIKFRAWDKSYPKMITDCLVENYKLALNLTGEVLGYEVSFEDDKEDEVLEYHDRFILMQYTGLKDKNGVEICESDIIIGESYGEYPLIIKWDDKLTGFYCHDPKGNEDDHLNMHEAVNGKVIGNVYTNPELLEGDTHA